MTILEEAHQAVYGKRLQDYGTPAVNHGRTADLWRTYLRSKYSVDIGLDAEDVCWLNILQKASREMNAPTRDGLVDVAGYAENIALVRDTYT